MAAKVSTRMFYDHVSTLVPLNNPLHHTLPQPQKLLSPPPLFLPLHLSYDSATYSICANSFPILSFPPFAILNVALQSLSYYMYFFLLREKTNLMCELFYANPTESTLLLLSRLIRKCDRAACKYIADWASPRAHSYIWHSLQVWPDIQVKDGWDQSERYGTDTPSLSGR